MRGALEGLGEVAPELRPPTPHGDWAAVADKGAVPGAAVRTGWEPGEGGRPRHDTRRVLDRRREQGPGRETWGEATRGPGEGRGESAPGSEQAWSGCAGELQRPARPLPQILGSVGPVGKECDSAERVDRPGSSRVREEPS